MKLYLDTDTNRFVNDPNFKSSIESVSFKRGDSATVELIFVSSNTALSAIEGKDIKFGIKESGKYDGDYVVYTDEYTTSGNSYILNPSFNTVALNTLLNHDDADDENDVASVSLMMEVTWSEDAVNWYSTNTITAVVENDVNKGTEGTPFTNSTPEEWLSSQLSAYNYAPLSANNTFRGNQTIIGNLSSNGSLSAVNANFEIINIRAPFPKGIIFKSNNASMAFEKDSSVISFAQSASALYTLGTYSYVTLAGNNSYISTQGTNSSIFTLGSNSHIYTESYTGYLGQNTATPTRPLDINNNGIRIRTAQTPATAGATGLQGEICWDTNYVYVCTATDTWKRAALSTW